MSNQKILLLFWGVIIVILASTIAYFLSVKKSQPVSDAVLISDKEHGISFQYPFRWGSWTIDPNPSLEDAFGVTEFTFSELVDTEEYPYLQYGDVSFVFRKYDDNEYRYEKTEIYDGTSEFLDLPKDKRDFLQNAKQVVAGIPATIVEHLDHGYVICTIRFYTPTHRVDMYARYDITDFLVALGGNDPNMVLSEVAQTILGEDLHNPINRLSAMYPKDLEKMIKFYKEVGRFTESIKIIK